MTADSPLCLSPKHPSIKILILAGPTGVGKSSFALKLAETLDGEIVSADSVQIYRGLDIGSAKPSKEEQQQVPHHMIDICDPHEHFDAAAFAQKAHVAVQEINARNRVPIVVGGTNLYIKALLYGLLPAPQPSPSIREEHRKRFDTDGPLALHSDLQQVDPVLADRLHPNDFIRVSRGLEVFALTGRPLSVLQKEHSKQPALFSFLLFSFTRPRETLYTRIEVRVDQMIADGLYQEWSSLVEQGVPPRSEALQSLGYRHMSMLQKATSKSEHNAVIDLLKRDTRRFAKQQLSWLRNDPNSRWVTLPDHDEVTLNTARHFLS